MKSRQERIRSQFQLETLEGRIALSSIGGADDAIHGHRGGHAAEIHNLRQGADDPANHNANDNRGGVSTSRRGADDPANHNVNDNRGGLRGGHGADDPANHNANDHRGGGHRRGRR